MNWKNRLKFEYNCLNNRRDFSLVPVENGKVELIWRFARKKDKMLVHSSLESV